MDLKFMHILLYYCENILDLKQQKWIGNLNKHEMSLICKIKCKITKLDIEYGNGECNKRIKIQVLSQSKRHMGIYIYFYTVVREFKNGEPQ